MISAPVVGRDRRRVDGTVELDVVDVIVEHPYLRHIVYEMVEVEGLERFSLGILDHADGATGVDEQYVGACLAFHGQLVVCRRQIFMRGRGG